mmetsp:Transcript_36092/g.52914  ORF Transcript_36092/g.52914 Transcript_36092/m.52914 type:complete len:217 (+) Transcript_36092:53-703(+)
MVFYFKTRCGEYTIYMGKDKFENEDLIKYGLPEDCWFHVDNLSSAHVYLRLKPDMKMDDIPEEAILDCATLVKANSIEGCKRKTVSIVYTRWKNLKKTSDMVEGQVGYHRPQNVKKINVEKDNAIVNALNKTKTEIYPHPNLYEQQQHRLKEIKRAEKQKWRKEEEARKLLEKQRKKEKEERSYDRIMTGENMTSNTDFEATEDATAAEDYEDDFF